MDTDVHLHEDPLVLARYCDPPWKDSLEAFKHVTPRFLDIPGFSFDWTMIDPPVPGRWVDGEAAGLHPDAGLRAATTGAQLQEELKAFHIDVGIVFPNNLLSLGVLPNPFYAAALARAYNRWITDEFLAGSPDLYAAIVAIPHNPHEGATEIRMYADHPQVRAIYLPTAAVAPLWGDRKYDPIYDAAQEAGLPICFHSVGLIHPNFPHQFGSLETEPCRHAISHPFSIMATLVSLISTGFPVRFPDLKAVFTEAGISWVPFLAWRLDKEYIELRRELPFYENRPSYYIKRQFRFATQSIEEPDDPQALVSLVDAFGGADPFIYASDWPHHDFDHPRQVFGLPFTPEQRTKIMGETARVVFRLDGR